MTEAVVLKTNIHKNKAAEADRGAQERAAWQKQHGVKGVTAPEPEGGW